MVMEGIDIRQRFGRRRRFPDLHRYTQLLSLRTGTWLCYNAADSSGCKSTDIGIIICRHILN